MSEKIAFSAKIVPQWGIDGGKWADYTGIGYLWCNYSWKLRWRERGMHIDNYLFATGRFDRLMENTKP